MKLVTISQNSVARIGVVIDDNQILIPALLQPNIAESAQVPVSLKGVLEGGEAELDRLRRIVASPEASTEEGRSALREQGALIKSADADFLPVIPEPMHILNSGATYRQHLEEMDDAKVPEYPMCFQSSAASLIGHQKAIMIPGHHPDMIDYEGELTVVIGRPCHRVEEIDAMDYIAGYTLMNDVSARDWVPEVFAATETMPAIEAWGRNTMGKQFPNFTPLGPCLVTRDEIPDPHDLDLTLRLNGEVMQRVHTSDLIFRIAEMVAYFSQWYALQPGDLIATGSPGGVGVARKPPVFMNSGDRVEVTATGLGTLSSSLRMTSEEGA